MRFCSRASAVQEHPEISLVAQALFLRQPTTRGRCLPEQSGSILLVSCLPAGVRAATLRKGWWSGRLQAASSIHRAVSSRCAYHHAASSASDLNLGILRFSFILLWRGVCGNRPDLIATKGEHDCQNTAGRPASPTLWCVLHLPQTGSSSSIAFGSRTALSASCGVTRWRARCPRLISSHSNSTSRRSTSAIVSTLL